LYDAISPAEILVAVPEEAIFLLMHSLVEPGGHVVVVTPAYQSLYDVARSAGCEVTRWTCARRARNGVSISTG